MNGLRFDQKKKKIKKKEITNIIRNIVSMSRTFFEMIFIIKKEYFVRFIL